MTIFVTGAQGFLGRHLSLHLSSRTTVAGLGHGHWTPAEATRWGLSTWHSGDISNAGLDSLSEEHGAPETIFHIAGGSAVGPSLANPMVDFNKSVPATMALCDWVRRNSPDTAIVLSSSAAVYGSGHASAIHEDADLHPYSPYGFHKRMTELALESYSQSFGIRTAIVRLFSVYGPELRKQLIWDLCQKLHAGNGKATLGGTGYEVRDWLHVSDAVRLLELAANHATSSCIKLNGGSGIPVNISDVAHLVANHWGAHTQITFSGQSRPGDPRCLLADSSKSMALGFQPDISLEDGIKNYVSWYREQAVRS